MKEIAERIRYRLQERRKCRVVLDPGFGDPEYFGKKFTMDRDEAEELAEEIWERETSEARRRWRKGTWAGERVRSRRLPIERWRIRVQSLAEHERDLRRERRRQRSRVLRSLWRRSAPLRRVVARIFVYVAALVVSAALLILVGSLAAAWISETLSVPVEQAGAVLALALAVLAAKMWTVSRGGRRHRG